VTDAPLIGVLALQGAFREHVRALEACGALTRLVRLPYDLDGLDGLVIPGGESTTMTMLMARMGLLEAVERAVLSNRITDGRANQVVLGALDIQVRRNGYGRQVDSFEADLDVPDLAGGPFPGVFIRAPLVEQIGAAEVLAEHDGHPVAVRQGSVMALAFHPELSGDLRFHREFLRLVEGARTA
jgi:5'-phosphate synthase pdxT subunit